MKALYHDLFYIPKHGKIREKVMLSRVFVTVCSILLCLFAMTFTAYAYFSCNISSSSNRIRSAHFTASISVTDTAGTPVPVESTADNTHLVMLQPNVTYTVTLTYDRDNSTAETGFFVMTAADGALVYHTQQLGKDTTVAGGNTPFITFPLTVSGTAEVTLLAHWGTSSYYNAYTDKTHYITDQKPVAITLPDSGAAQGHSAEVADHPTESNVAESAQSTEPTPSEITTTETSSVQPAETFEAAQEADTDSAQPDAAVAVTSSGQNTSQTTTEPTQASEKPITK